MTASHVMLDPANIRQFVLAGDAKLTLRSLKTERHYTYKVEQATDKETGEGIARWFVKVLTGPDNWANYTYAGCIVGRDENFVLTSGSRFTEEAESIKAWRYFWAGIQAGRVMPLLEVRHEGRCGRCGRALTTPESIDTGFGPDCADMLGIVWAVRTGEANGTSAAA